MSCTAQAVLDSIDTMGRVGAMVNMALMCQAEGGVMVFPDEGLTDPVKGSLWRTYKFPDGSYLNLYPKGCTCFYSEGEYRKAITLVEGGAKWKACNPIKF